MPSYLVNSFPGKGKTELLVDKICDGYKNNPNIKVIYVAPTKELQYQIRDRLIEKLPIGHNVDIQVLNTDTIENDTTVKSTYVDIVKDIETRGPTVIIITAPTALNLYNQDFHKFDISIADEEIKAVRHELFNPSDDTVRQITILIAENLMEVKDSIHEDYYEVSFKKLDGDYMEKFISSMNVLSDSLQSNKKVLVLKEAYHAFIKGEIKVLTFTIIENVLFLQQAKETYFLGFDIKNSEMVKMYEKFFNFTYTDITNPADMSYSNDINIYYLSEEDIGNGKLAENDDFKDNILQSYQNHLNQNTLICDFNFKGYDPKEYNFHNVLPAKSHGLNKDEWTTKTDVAIFAHFRHSPEEFKFLSKMGLSKKEADRAREGNIFVQVLARSAIRLKGNTLTTNIFLIDRRSANIVKELLGNSNVTLHKISPVREFEETGKKVRKNKSNITQKEKCRMSYLRRKKRINSASFSSANQLELAALILKTGKTPRV